MAGQLIHRLALAAALLALAACGGDKDARLDDEAAAAAPAANTAPACTSRLPLTGLCATARDDDFLRVNTLAPKLAADCAWATREVAYAEGTALVFRAQDCSAEGFVPVTYSFLQGYVKYRMNGTPEDQAQFMLQVIALEPGETAEQAAVKTLDMAPENQRNRCAPRPLKGPVLAGQAFELAPNRELESEIDANAGGEAWNACGPNGVTTDAVQFWEARNGYALFHMLGQDDPPWDPASFTFYRKNKDGKWTKAG